MIAVFASESRIAQVFMDVYKCFLVSMPLGAFFHFGNQKTNGKY